MEEIRALKQDVGAPMRQKAAGGAGTSIRVDLRAAQYIHEGQLIPLKREKTDEAAPASFPQSVARSGPIPPMAWVSPIAQVPDGIDRGILAENLKESYGRNQGGVHVVT